MCKLTKRTTRNQGFTLVELSIVIIIIGFLIAGIAAGTSLIKQAEISSVISDMQSYQTAYNNFILRYNGIPGDLKNIENYFPSCGANAGDCNGNGDGLITWAATITAGGPVDESYTAWRSLSLANMISAGITAPDDGSWAGGEVLGSTVPTSKVTGAGYLMAGSGSPLGGTAASAWSDGVNNAVYIGKVDSGGGLDNSALKSEDAFNIDKKIDDGTVSGSSFTGAQTGNVRAVNGADGTCLTGANYDLTQTSAGCVSGLALN